MLSGLEYKTTIKLSERNVTEVSRVEVLGGKHKKILTGMSEMWTSAANLNWL